MGLLYKFYIQLILPLAYFACGVMRTSAASLAYVLFFFLYAGWNLSEGLRFGTLVKPILTAIISLASMIIEIVYYCDQTTFTDLTRDIFGLVAPHSKGLIGGGLSGNIHLALYFVSDVFALLFSIITILVIFIHSKNMNKAKELASDEGEESATKPVGASAKPISEVNDDSSANYDEYDETDSIQSLHFVPTLPLWRAVLAVVFASLSSAFEPSVVFLPYVVFVVATIIYIAFPRYGRLSQQRINVPYWTSAWGIPLSLYILAHMLTTYTYQFPFVSAGDGATIARWLGVFKYSKLTDVDYWPLCVADLCTAVLFILVSPSLNSIEKMSNAEALRRRRKYSGLTEEILCISAHSFAENSREESSCPSAAHSPSEFESSTHSTSSSARDYSLPQTVLEAEKADANAAAAAATRRTKRPRKDYRIAKALYPHGWKIFMVLFYVLPFMAPGIPMFVLLLTVTVSTFLDAYKSALFCPFVLFLSLLYTCVQYVFNIKFPALLNLRYANGPLLDDLSLPLVDGQLVGLFFGYQFILMFFAATYVRFQNLLICVGLYGPSLGSYPLSDMEEEEGMGEDEDESETESENNGARVATTKLVETDDDNADGKDEAESVVAGKKNVDGKEPAGEDVKEAAEGYTLTSALGLFGIDEKNEKDNPVVVFAEKVDKFFDELGDKFKAFGKRMKSVLAYLFIKLLKYSYLITLIVIYFACLRSSNGLNFIYMILFLVFVSFPKIAIDHWLSLVRYSQFVLHLRYIWQIHWTPSHKDHIILSIIGLKKYPDQNAGQLLLWEILVVLFATIQMFFLQVVNQTEPADKKAKDKAKSESSNSAVMAEGYSAVGEVDDKIKQRLISEDDVDSDDDSTPKAKNAQDVPSYIAVQYRSRNAIQKLYREIEGRTPDSVNSIIEIIKYGLCTMGLLFCVLAFLIMGIFMRVSVISISYIVIAFIIMNFIFYTDNFASKLRKIWPIFLVWQAITLFACYAFQFGELRKAIEKAYKDTSMKDYFGLDEWGLYRLRKNCRFVGLLPHILLFLVSTVQFSLLKRNEGLKTPTKTNIYKWVTYVSNFICRFVFEYAPFIMYVFAIVIFLNRVTVVHFILLVFISLSRLHPMGIDGIGGSMMWCSEILSVFELLYNTKLFSNLDEETVAIFKWVGFDNKEKPFDKENPTEIHNENWSMLYVHIILIVLICIERVTLRWGRKEAETVERDHDTPRDIPLLMVLDNYPSKTPEEKTRSIKVINFIDRLPGLLYYQATFTLLCICLFIRAKSLVSLLYLVAIVVTISVRSFNFRRWVFPFSIIVMVITFIQYLTTLASKLNDCYVVNSSESSEQGTNYLFTLPWDNMGDELQEFLLLKIQYPRIMLADFMLSYFLSVLHFLPEEYCDLFTVMSVARNNESFPQKPRSKTDNFVFVVVQYLALITAFILFIIGCLGENIISCVILILSMIMLIKGDFLMESLKLWRVLSYIAYGIIGFQIFFQFVYAIIYNFVKNDSDSSFGAIRKIGAVFGFTWSPVENVTPSTEVLFLVSILFFISFQLAFRYSLDKEYTKVTEYVDTHLSKMTDRAYRATKFEYDIYIKALEATFEEKKRRKERLQKLREDRKKKSLMWLQSSEDFSEVSTTGGSVLSEDEALIAEEERLKEEGLNEEKKEIDVPLKLKLVTFLKYSVVDNLIFYFHGPEGRHPSNTFAKDLDALEKEHEITAKDLAIEYNKKKELEELEKQRKKDEEAGKKVSPALPESQSSSSSSAQKFVADDGKEFDAEEEAILKGLVHKQSDEPEFVRKTRSQLFFKGLSMYLKMSTKALCLIAFVLNHLFNGTLLSLVYVLIGFGYVTLSRKSHPRKGFWTGMMIYTAFVACLKLFIQFPGFCMCHAEDYNYWYYDSNLILNRNTTVCTQDYCNRNTAKGAEFFSIPYLLGIVPRLTFFFSIAVWDFVVLIVIWFHLRQMKSQGMWGEKMKNALIEEHHRMNKRREELIEEEKNAAPTMAMATCDVEGGGTKLSFKKGDIIKVVVHGTKPGDSSIGEFDGITGMFDLSKTVPYIGTAKRHVDIESDDENNNDNEEEEDSDGKSSASSSSRSSSSSSSSSSSDDEIDEDLDLTLGILSRGSNKIVVDEELCEGDGTMKKDGIEGDDDENKPLKQRLKDFFTILVLDDTKIGRDMYTPIFITEFVCLLYLVIFGATFTGSAGQLIDYIQQSYIPGPYVLILIIQFVFIVVDRIAYIVKSPLTKLIIQFLSIILFNVMFLWYFPWKMEMSMTASWKSPFTRSTTLQIFYLLKCVYWFLSGIQIREGYPMLNAERLLMQRFEFPYSTIFTVYRSIPFVYEIRTIMDWTFLKTTQNFWNYLKIEDAYATLFKAKCLQVDEKGYNRKPGDNRTKMEKATTGFGFFLVIIVIIWLPLILMSSIVPGVNVIDYIDINHCEVEVRLTGWVSLYSQTLVSNESLKYPLTNKEFNEIKNGRPFVEKNIKSVQIITMRNYSESVWDITDPSKDSLIRGLKDVNKSITMTSQLMFRRDSSSNSELYYKNSFELTQEQKNEMYDALTNDESETKIILSNLLPRIIKIPGSSGDTADMCDNGKYCVPIQFTLTYHKENVNGSSGRNNFWVLEQIPEEPGVIYDGSPTKGSAMFSDILPRIVLLNTPVSPASSLIGSLAALGIIGIYVSVVLVVANAIRGMTSGLSRDIMFENLPDCDELLQLCKDIILARLDGDLLLEEELSNELIQIYRSPETIIEKTRVKIKATNTGNFNKEGGEEEEEEEGAPLIGDKEE